MGIKCPKCNTDNPDTQKFCGECATPLPSSKEIPVTKTLEKSIQELIGGTTFAGRYQIIEELGRGGMGVVYKAQDTKLKRTVALKFLPQELTHISEVKERFMREAQAAAALDHPHICTVYEFDETEEKTFISMAYIEGESLKKKIESGPFELNEALRIAIQAAEGLQEAHKKGVVHRDIKSANIMVTEKDEAKIMDFGLARVTGTTLVTKEGMTMGTIAYMSPEQARGEKVDQRTDIWSFGVVLYEMFSGQLPFKGDHDQAIVYSILNEKPKPIMDLHTEIPMSIEQVVAKALEKNPDERYQNIDELLDDLRSISEGIEPEGIRVRLWKAKLLRGTC
jgi:serine/threonine protein kinase